jgi:hypothetical protein
MVYGSSGVVLGMTSALSVLPLAVLDFVGIEHAETPAEAIRGAVGIAQAVERAGYGRLWVSEHHNVKSLACSAPELLVGHLASQTETLRVGAAGIMLPNHAAFKVAELFRTLLAMHPGRIGERRTTPCGVAAPHDDAGGEGDGVVHPRRLAHRRDGEDG